MSALLDSTKKLGPYKAVVVSLLITASVLAVLILAGRAGAVNLIIEGLPSTIVKGDQVEFFLTVEVEDFERVPIKELELDITGPTPVNARFLASGQIIESSPQIQSITLVSNTANFGYGYLFGRDPQTGYG